MRLHRRFLAVAGVLSVALLVETSALAGPFFNTAPGAQPSGPSRSAAEADGAAHPHASLRLEVGGSKAWIGQSLPITLRAIFRNVEGVTLEGAPQLDSTGVFTSSLDRDPHQATQVIDGESVLVVTWKGTVTPSSAAPLTISAQLPVHLQYHDPAPHIERRIVRPSQDPFGDDPFGAFGNDPFDSSLFDQMENEMRQPLGRAHDEAATLKAAAQSVDVSPLPTEGQPASFTGSIGHFKLKASVSTKHASVSEPVTLTIGVDGDGNLDGVELKGVETSDAWKAYPPKSTVEPASEGKRARKVFEQVLVPLRGGDLTVPAVSLSSFDPVTGKYVTTSTAPTTISVDGTAAAVHPLDSSGDATAVAQNGPSPSSASDLPLVTPQIIRPSKVAWWLAPLLPILILAFWVSRPRSKRTDRAFKRAMRSAAARGQVVPFYQAAHSFIAARLAMLWDVEPEHVNETLIYARLGGAAGDVLAGALATGEAVRFGRAHLESAELLALCCSIEKACGAAGRARSSVVPGNSSREQTQGAS